jgi:hypothetical protein
MHLRCHELRKTLFEISPSKSSCLSYLMEPGYFLVGNGGGVASGLPCFLSAIGPNECNAGTRLRFDTSLL